MSHDNPEPTAFWEARYLDTDGDRVWSGRANQTLTAVVSDLKPGTALDLGCGEGGDAIWLARRGWTVTGLDVSPTAIRRATEAAREADLPAESVRFVATDLAEWESSASYDLVTASFLHSPIDFPRTEVLRRAAERVADGGHLLIVSHEDAPPWAGSHEHHARDADPDRPEHRFLSPSEELEALDLDPAHWTVELAETRDRDAVGPDDTQAVLSDVVVFVRREPFQSGA